MTRTRGASTKVREKVVFLFFWREGEKGSSFLGGGEEEKSWKCVLREREELKVSGRESSEHKALLVPLGLHASAGFAL